MLSITMALMEITFLLGYLFEESVEVKQYKAQKPLENR